MTSAKLEKERWPQRTRRMRRKNAKESGQKQALLSLACGLLIPHCEPPVSVRHCARAMNPPIARSPMCRAAAHRGCFASPPAERCAHFGLRKAGGLRSKVMQRLAAWVPSRSAAAAHTRVPPTDPCAETRSHCPRVQRRGAAARHPRPTRQQRVHGLCPAPGLHVWNSQTHSPSRPFCFSFASLAANAVHHIPRRSRKAAPVQSGASS